MGTSSLVFVGGVHGVGKSRICEGLAAALGALHLVASELIASTGVSPASRDKRVVDIADNQRRLIDALAGARQGQSTVVLDGHFSVLDEAGQPVRVDIGVFAKIAPSSMLLITAEAVLIRERLQARDGRAPSIDYVRALLDYERDAADRVSRSLAVPLHVADWSDPIDDVVDALRGRA